MAILVRFRFMRSNIILIQHFIDSDVIRKYAVFLKLKHSYSNSQIYNYTAYSLSKKSGLSITTINKYVNFFIENGWVKIIGSNIIFIGNEKLKEKYGIKLNDRLKIQAHHKQSVQNILCTLRYEVYKLKQRQFNYVQENVKNQLNPRGKNALNKYKKAIKSRTSYNGEISQHLKIGLGKLSLMINKSASTASRLIRKKKATVIKGRKSFIKSPNISLPSDYYWKKGYAVKVECNSYIF